MFWNLYLRREIIFQQIRFSVHNYCSHLCIYENTLNWVLVLKISHTYKRNLAVHAYNSKCFPSYLVLQLSTLLLVLRHVYSCDARGQCQLFAIVDCCSPLPLPLLNQTADRWLMDLSTRSGLIIPPTEAIVPISFHFTARVLCFWQDKTYFSVLPSEFLLSVTVTPLLHSSGPR